MNSAFVSAACIVIAAILVWFMRRIHSAADPWIGSAAMILVAAGGSLAGYGLLGKAIDWVSRMLESAGSTVTTAAFGVAAYSLIVVFWACVWIGALIPPKYCSIEPSQRIIWSGLFLPAAVGSVQGVIGSWLGAFFGWITTVASGIVAQGVH